MLLLEAGAGVIELDLYHLARFPYISCQKREYLEDCQSNTVAPSVLYLSF